MRKLRNYILITVSVVCLAFVSVPVPVGAESLLDDACAGDAANTALCKENLKKETLPKVLKDVVNVMLYLLGAVSVIFIVLSGIYYVTSGGDASNITRAKNTLLYSVIGLIVAIMAWAIVNFVVDKFGVYASTATPAAPPAKTSTP